MKEGFIMSKNTYYWTCPKCKANLDPGERCDCEKEQNIPSVTITKQSEDKKKEDRKFADLKCILFK
jgi:hypothetical protein